MKSIALGAALSLAVLCDAPESCRCEERTLDAYFADADEVVVAQLNTLRAVPGSAEVDLTFRLLGDRRSTISTMALAAATRTSGASVRIACASLPRADSSPIAPRAKAAMVRLRSICCWGGSTLTTSGDASG